MKKIINSISIKTTADRQRSPSPRGRSPNRDLREIQCYTCKEMGHYISQCQKKSWSAMRRNRSPSQNNKLREAAQVTLMSEDFAKKVKLPVIFKGSLMLKGTGKDNSIKARLDFLKQLDSVINLSDLSITIKGEKHLINEVKAEKSSFKVCRITLDETLIVPPNSTVRLPVNLSEEFGNEVAICSSRSLNGQIMLNILTKADFRHPLVLKDGILCYKLDPVHSRLLLVVPRSLKHQLLENCHDIKLSGHFGQAKTIERLKQSYIWYRLHEDTRNYVKSNKIENIKPNGPLGPFHSGIAHGHPGTIT
ncbi:unnamed protein product [Mytilus coruscus]|uniref:CCHC-type domain-containing protein n=1 Tax=Mytilus coruscus TaxID=42192 RepID=A0A6J8AZI8_MYTCO|nr:unnamed protein product [Mytilus coruscus]